jgi:hypothetical protein
VVAVASERASASLVDLALPVYDVSDGVATVVEAGAARAWAALMAVDLIELGHRRPTVGALGGVRFVPQLVAQLGHGKLPHGPEHMTLRDTTTLPPERGGWVLLGERPTELALGLVGKFWRPVIEYRRVAADEFADFAEPGFAKTVYALEARPLSATRTLLTGTMRTATTDDHARRWFRRYWTAGVGPGAHVLVNALLDVAGEDAESG